MQNGGVFTFGACMYGQLGHNHTTHEYLPRQLVDLMGSEVTQIACGRCHVLVYVGASQRLYSFGLAGSGQLGVGATNINKLNPSSVKCDLANPDANNANEFSFNVMRVHDYHISLYIYVFTERNCCV